VVVLSGHIGAGKSELAKGLQDRYGFVLAKTRELIQNLKPEVPADRKPLQAAGAALDAETNGAWVASALERRLATERQDCDIVIDAVRIKQQIDALRNAYGPKVIHVHLTAPMEELKRRYEAREASIAEFTSYAESQADPTEGAIESLASVADVLIDTSRNTRSDVLARVAGRLRLHGSGFEPLVDVIVGGQYGSEGKGHIASYLAPEYDVLVRVGGPNAGHTVFAGATSQVFKHIPSGATRAPEALLVLGPGAILWWPELQEEISSFGIDLHRLAIDPQAMLIEQIDRDREVDLRAKIASTAQGVGQALARKSLRSVADPVVRLARDEPSLRPYLRPTAEVLEDSYARGHRVMLEGTQGTDLSIHHGVYPYVTSRDTTAAGCMAEAGIPPARVRRVVMVCRTYPIRVGGRSGPMDQEIDWAEVSQRSGIPVEELTAHEHTTRTKTLRRVSEFSWSRIRRAAVLNGPTDIALTFADYFTIQNRDARRFDQLDSVTVRFVEELEGVTQAPVSLIAVRFHWRSIIDRRRW
jgi:adenylosuccinate synthase